MKTQFQQLLSIVWKISEAFVQLCILCTLEICAYATQSTEFQFSWKIYNAVENFSSAIENVFDLFCEAPYILYTIYTFTVLCKILNLKMFTTIKISVLITIAHRHVTEFCAWTITFSKWTTPYSLKTLQTIWIIM